MTSSTADQQLCRRFSLAEIHSATGDFSEAHVIGRGGFGKVYRGLIDNGSASVTVAVKRLSSNSNQGEREFAAEMEALTKFRHRNLVSLIGYCSEQNEMILVYEYLPNGTLADHLHSSNGSSLTWNQRLRICIGAGRGLDYLHSGCSIIHRDVKSTNILLDDDFTAKVSDFGLAKNLSTVMLERSFVSASVKGTFGYFDPSYFTTGRLTKASDTYAYGVLLLEVLTGKPPIRRNLAADELCMTMWAQEKIRNGKADQIVDLNLKGRVSEGCLKTFVGVVKKCLLYEPKKRLTMTRAVAQLEFALEQQERKGIMTAPRILQFWPFWNKVIPSGTEKDENEFEVDKLQQTVPAIEEEDAVENKQSHVDMQPIAAPAIPHDDHIVRAIPLAEIKDITGNFSGKCMIPFGRGHAFHGILKSGQKVAIIKLYKGLPNHEFIRRVSKSSSLKHDNVVELIGYCLDGDLRALVYEFAPRGSLHDVLLGQEAAGVKGLYLSWAQRVKIAIGIATGLCYIHDKNLIHHDIESSNVLLFDNEIAKITNLHLSPECSCEESYCDKRRPLGYPLRFVDYPPENLWRGPTQKGDVYCFGVILLELLTGRTDYNCTRRLVSWLGPGNVHNIVDARLKADYPRNAVESMAKLAQSCLHYETKYRPDMSLVLQDLKLLLPKPHTLQVEH